MKGTTTSKYPGHGAQSGKQNIKKGFEQGFSTFELVITLSLTAILAGASIPYYQDAINKRHITNGAEQIVTFVRTIQGESIKRNKMVSVSYTVQDDGAWCIAATEGSTPCECSQNDATETDFCPLDSSTWILRDTEVDTKHQVSLIAGDGDYAYDPVRGILADPTDNMMLALQSGKGQFQMNLSVVSTGLVSLCRPADSHPIGGLNTCPTQL